MSACSLGTTGSDGSHDRITLYSYDVLSNVTSTTSAYGTGSARADFTKVYDDTSSTGTGTLTYVEDAKGNRTSYYYDSFDRLVKTCYPLPGTAHASSTTDCAQTVYRTTSLTGANQIGTLANYVSLRDGNNNYYTYDALGRVSQISGAEGQTFTYDNFNDVLTHGTSTSGTTGTETYTYNAMGWVVTDVQPMGQVGYEYDAYGRRSRLWWPGSFYMVYNYDAGNELVSVQENAAATILTFDYDDYGRRAHLYSANGVTTTYGYDGSLRLGTLTQGSSGASFYNQITYGYNAADQIASKAGNNSSYNYTPAARSTGYGIDGLNRIASVNGTNFSYDGRGNLSGDGSGSTYGYNVDNLLTSATQSSVTSTLTYDPEDRLYKISKQNGATTQFLYDGSDLIAEYDGSGNLLRRYVHGPGDDEPLVMYDYTNGGAKTYLHADDNGTVNLITSASGSQVAINTYDEYGLPGSGNTGRFQYTGQAWLSEIGMYYYKARLYNPAIGRFMQTDPIGYADGMNWYNYVHGDPVNGSDPTGLAMGLQCHDTGYTYNHDVFHNSHTYGPDGEIIQLASVYDPSESQHNAIQACNGEGSPFDQYTTMYAGAPGGAAVGTSGNHGDTYNPACQELGAVVGSAIGKLNNAPNSAIGHLWGEFNMVAGALMGKHTYVTYGNNAVQYMNAPFEAAGRAVTLGNVQVYPAGDGPGSTMLKSYSAYNVNVGLHEEGHTHQGEWLGMAYLPAEAIGSLLGDKNFMEVGADKYEKGTSCSGF